MLGHKRLVRAVITADFAAALLRQHLLRQTENRLRLHIAYHHQAHIGRGIKRLMAIVQRLGGDMGNALHRACHRYADRAFFIQALHEIFIDLPFGIVLNHADLLGNNSLLLGNAFLRKIGNRHKGEQNFQILKEMLRGIKIVGRHGIGGEGIGLSAVLCQLLQGIALRRVKHLMLQVMGNACRCIQPFAVLFKTHIHAAVACGKHGIFAAESPLGNDTDRQSVRQRMPDRLLAKARIIDYMQLTPPPFPSGNTRCPAQYSVLRHRCAPA